MNQTLSKSEFKLATNCYTKLKYKKAGYPKSSDTDEFMEMLAEGGYMVGKLATLLYPGGIDINIDKTHNSNIYENTAAWLKHDKVVLFEAAFKCTDGKNIRVDILEKIGNQINLIEVKAKSWNSETYVFNKQPSGSIKKNVANVFKPYLEDVTFQYSVLKELYPNHSISPFLFLPDKAASTNIEGLNGLFSIEKMETTSSGFKNYDVTFNGELDLLLKDKIMVRVDVSNFVNSNLSIIENRSKEMLTYMNEGFSASSFPVKLDGKCKSCEFRIKDDKSEKNGFNECWGELASHPNHIFDLYQFGNIFKGDAKKQELDSLIGQSKIAIQDIPDELFRNAKGDLSYNARPYNQKHINKEKISDELKAFIEPLQYPLYFIDFECSRMALPYHQHMRPYELVAYQWSCHIVANENTEPVHHEWINTTDEFPNFKFAASLYNLLKDAGTILIWSTYEKTVLKEILLQYEHYQNNGIGDVDLITDQMQLWLLRWRDTDKEDQSWICDMEKLSKKYYFHPYTKGKSSIKPTLPAILNESESADIVSWLTNFGDGLNLYKKEDGIVQDPYYSLPKIDFDDLGFPPSDDFDDEMNDSTGTDSIDYVVKNGGAAMRAYQDMMYGFAKADDNKKIKIKNSLLQYCKLDTLAMVIIWKYWKSKF
ncbi:MAG: DUF2779 domain-containing protein [Ferruginibacter sp.]